MDLLLQIRNIKLETLDTSHEELKYVAFYDNNYFEINQATHDLIKIIQTSNTLAEITKRYSQKREKSYDQTEIEYIISNKLSTLTKGDSLGKPSERVFLYNRELISSAYVNKLASMLEFLYKNSIMVLIFIAYIVLSTFFFYDFFDSKSILSNQFNLYTLVIVLVSLFISTFFHELGHAAASKYFGVSPGSIGFGVYINMPVFYADVSGIWKLDRKKRLVVNIGGIYFQLILLLPCYLFYFYTYNNFIGYFIICSNINFLFVLNPFFRFDGYWIMSDILGIPNLRKNSMELIFYFFNKPQNKKKAKIPVILNSKPQIKYIALLYSILFILFMICFFCYFLPKFFYSYLKELPDMISFIEQKISLGVIPFDTIYYIIPKTLLIILLIYFVSKKIILITKSAVNKLKH